MFYDIYVSLCRKVGVSPSKAAEDIGLSRTSVNKWKNGTVPSGATINKLADYFGVSVDYILNGEKAPAEGGDRFSEDELIRLNADELDFLREIREKPEMKIMFSVTKNATKEDLIKAIKIIEALKPSKEENNGL